MEQTTRRELPKGITQKSLCIEPERGSTYERPGRYAVYGYGVYERSSVLAGQSRRVFIDSFDSLETAKAAYPKAQVTGSRFEETRASIKHLPDEDGNTYTPDDWD